MKLTFFFFLFSILFQRLTLADNSCIDCICKHATGCRPIGCVDDVGSLSCGYFKIKKLYYEDCGTPGRGSDEDIVTAWKRCADDYNCARSCVEAYTKRWSRRCPMGGCEAKVRVHAGGPRGCFRNSTTKYWNEVKACCGCE